MHVPVYCPAVCGVQEREKRGVVVEVKKVMDMVDMVMDVVEELEDEDDMDISMIVYFGEVLASLRGMVGASEMYVYRL